MGTWLYCVLPADAPAPRVTGIDGRPVRALSAGGVSAWVSDVPSTPRPELGRIRAHDAVIRAAQDAGFTPVPIRWGQVTADDDAVRAHLEERDYRPDLARIAGCVEFGVRVLDPDAPDATPGDAREEARGSGAAYLRLVAERMHALERTRARALDAARSIDAALGAWVRERRIDPTERPAGAVVAHLVQAGAASDYAEQAKALAHAHPPLRVVVTGPWPPYSFVA
ncbi:MAG TPA: GvpL/GvpF family gas vesicle protein [Longimicrobiales bacterium]